MKLLFALAVSVALSPTVTLGQGMLNFSNRGNGVDAPVYDWDGTTKLFGPTFAADLFWAPGIVSDSTELVALGQPAVFATNGYFFGGTRSIPGQQAGATVTLQVRVWDVPHGSSWLQVATTYGGRIGESLLFQGTLAGSGSGAQPLIGLVSFYLRPVGLDLPPLPEPILLSIASGSPDSLVFSWPSYWQGWTFGLQQTTNLAPTSWLTLTNKPVEFGSQTQIFYQITIPRPSSTTFYRLSN